MPLRLLALTLLASGAVAFAAQPPDLGPSTFVFNPRMPPAQMQSTIDRIYASQQHAEFSPNRFCILLLPGEYHLDIPIGFYTQVLGLGASPDDTHVIGNVHVDAASRNNNATTTFWRAAENFSVTPTDSGTLRWAVSQAVSFRRMHVLGNMALHQNGWASGGWLSDSVIDGTVDSGPQQQWISRNARWHNWSGSNWNMVFVGVYNPPPGFWPKPAYTAIAATPVMREKPFLVADLHGALSVRVPALAHNNTGPTWSADAASGREVPLNAFYIAHPDTDTADTLNRALAQGKHLLLTPGIYPLSAPLHITRPGTLVIGLGLATLLPTRGIPALITADVDGITISGILFDAGKQASPSLMQVGSSHLTSTRHNANPTALYDVFFRVGGAAPGKTIANLVINSNDVIVDHTWIWRADHGTGVGWDLNTSQNGLIVNGSDVTIYGLFVEHHQQYQVLWNGERGRTYFYQSEIPYDPPTQAAWSSAPSVHGFASYKVADSVHDHQAFGLGIYSVFRHPDVILSDAIEVPERSTIHFEHMVTVALDNLGEITHIVNDTGAAATTAKPRVDPRLDVYPAAAP